MAYKIYPNFLELSVPSRKYPETAAGLQAAIDDAYAGGGGLVTVGMGAVIGAINNQVTITLKPNTGLVSSTATKGLHEQGIGQRPYIFRKIETEIPVPVVLVSNDNSTPVQVTTASHNLPIGTEWEIVLKSYVTPGIPAPSTPPSREFFATVLSSTTFALYEMLPESIGGVAVVSGGAEPNQTGFMRLASVSYSLIGISQIVIDSTQIAASSVSNIEECMKFVIPDDGPTGVAVSLRDFSTFYVGAWTSNPVIKFGNEDTGGDSILNIYIEHSTFDINPSASTPTEPVLLVDARGPSGSGSGGSIIFADHDSTWRFPYDSEAMNFTGGAASPGMRVSMHGSDLRGRINNSCDALAYWQLELKDVELQTTPSGQSAMPTGTQNKSCINTGSSPDNHEVTIQDCEFSPYGPTIFGGQGTVSSWMQGQPGNYGWSNQNTLTDLPEGAVFIDSVSYDSGTGILTVTTAGDFDIQGPGASKPCVVLMGYDQESYTQAGWEGEPQLYVPSNQAASNTFDIDIGTGITDTASFAETSGQPHGVVWGGKANQAIMSTAPNGNDTTIEFVSGVPDILVDGMVAVTGADEIPDGIHQVTVVNAGANEIDISRSTAQPQNSPSGLVWPIVVKRSRYQASHIGPLSAAYGLDSFENLISRPGRVAHMFGSPQWSTGEVPPPRYYSHPLNEGLMIGGNLTLADNNNPSGPGSDEVQTYGTVGVVISSTPASTPQKIFLPWPEEEGQIFQFFVPPSTSPLSSGVIWLTGYSGLKLDNVDIVSNPHHIPAVSSTGYILILRSGGSGSWYTIRVGT